MDNQSPLAMQFKQFDADADGKLNPDEVYQLLKLLGKNIYKGSVTSAAALINSVGDLPSQTLLFTFPQFKQFYQSLDNPLKHDIWKSRYKILDLIRQIRNSTDKKQQTTAAPGAKPSPVEQSPFRGDVQVLVGPPNQNYNSYVHLNLQKTAKAESKPFIKIVFEQSSSESAKQLEAKIKKFQSSLFQLMKSSDPESAQILDYIHIITNVSESKLNVFITTSNEALIDLGSIASQFLDRALGAKFQANLNFRYQFNVDINKFIDSASDYSFYHALTQNYHLKMVWNAFNFKQSAKGVFKALDIFKDFKYDKVDPSLLTLIGLLHTDICEVNLVFENADFLGSELDTKNQILEGLGELQVKLSEQTQSLGLYEVMSSFQNKLSVQASIGDWKAQANIRIQDVKQLLSKKLLPEQNQNPPIQSQYNAENVNAPVLSMPMPDVLSAKSSSSGSLVKPIKVTPGKKSIKSPSSSLNKEEKSKSVQSDCSKKKSKPRKKSLTKQKSGSSSSETLQKVKIPKAKKQEGSDSSNE